MCHDLVTFMTINHNNIVLVYKIFKETLKSGWVGGTV
jgi:hypothetical protein